MLGSQAARQAPVPQDRELPRARGEIILGVGGDAARSVALDVGQGGCARVRFPRPDHPAVEAVLINTAGGLTDGDRISALISVHAGAALTVTTQAAEKVYRSRGAAAEVSTSLRVADGAALAWMPQETILFDRARLVRRTVAEIGTTARLVACESIVFGRIAHGETVREGLVHDSWRVSRGGRLVWADGLRLEGDIEEQLGHPALLDGRHALATVIYLGEDAAALLEPARAWLEIGAIRAGVSCRHGILVMRLAAVAAQQLRLGLSVLLARLRAVIGAGPARMPGAWAC